MLIASRRISSCNSTAKASTRPGDSTFLQSISTNLTQMLTMSLFPGSFNSKTVPLSTSSQMHRHKFLFWNWQSFAQAAIPYCLIGLECSFLTLVPSRRQKPSTLFFRASYGPQHTRQEVLLGWSAPRPAKSSKIRGVVGPQAILLRSFTEARTIASCGAQEMQ